MKGTIVLSRREAHRARVMERVTTGVLTLKQASELLGISYRQAKRVKNRYARDGAAGLAHGNRGRPVAHAIPEGVPEQIISLHEQVYGNFNDTHFTEMLGERENIHFSREAVRRILRRAGKAPKRKRRSPKHRSRRPRRPERGIMMQWDGSPHRWFGPEEPPCCLMGAIDDADGTLLGALFVRNECAIGYLRLLDMVIDTHGAPLSVYQDCHTIHRRADDNWSIEEEILGERFPTHVGRVIKEFGIEPIFAHSAQAKGRIERAFGILQDRLIAELSLHKISDIDTANRWLKEHFIPRHNKHFAKNPQQPGSSFAKISKRDRYRKIAFAYESTVTNDNCVSLKGLVIHIPPGKQRRSFARAQVLVKQHLDGAWTVWYSDQKIATRRPTLLVEPLRSWKRRRKGDPKGAKHMIQVYLDSRPAPLP